MTELGHVVVVGGGIGGCTVAYLLSREGVRVTLVERESIAWAASGAAAGNLMPSSRSTVPGMVETEEMARISLEMSQASVELHKGHIAALKEETTIDLLDHKVLYLYPALTEEQASEVRAQMALLDHVGVPMEWLEPKDILHLEPQLNPAVLGGMVRYDCIQLDPYRLCLALVQAAERRGATVSHGDVVGLERRNGAVQGVRLANGRVLGCDAAVLSLGPWSTVIGEWTGVPTPVSPYKGERYHLRLQGPLVACGVRWAGLNIHPRKDGFLGAGTTPPREITFDTRPTEEGLRYVLERLLQVLPDIEGEVVQRIAGLRPVPPDNLPIVGMVPDWEGLYLATALGRSGIVMSALVGHMTVDLMLHGRRHCFLRYMDPLRFAHQEAG